MAFKGPPAWLAELAGPTGPQTRTHQGEGGSVFAWTVSLELEGYRPDGLTIGTEYGKPLVAARGREPVDGSCAEVEVAKIASAWWSDGFGRAPSRWDPYIRRANEWQGPVGELLERIRESRPDGRRGGVPDVVAYRDGALLLLECKGADRFKATQLGWLETARALGIDGSSFVVCQFTVM